MSADSYGMTRAGSGMAEVSIEWTNQSTRKVAYDEQGIASWVVSSGVQAAIGKVRVRVVFRDYDPTRNNPHDGDTRLHLTDGPVETDDTMIRVRVFVRPDQSEDAINAAILHQMSHVVHYALYGLGTALMDRDALHAEAHELFESTQALRVVRVL